MWNANLGFKCKTPFMVVSKWFTVSYTKCASKWIQQSRVSVQISEGIWRDTRKQVVKGITTTNEVWNALSNVFYN